MGVGCKGLIDVAVMKGRVSLVAEGVKVGAAVLGGRVAVAVWRTAEGTAGAAPQRMNPRQ